MPFSQRFVTSFVLIQYDTASLTLNDVRIFDDRPVSHTCVRTKRKKGNGSRKKAESFETKRTTLGTRNVALRWSINERRCKKLD